MDMGRKGISTRSRVFKEALHEKVTSEQSPETREQSRPGPLEEEHSGECEQDGKIQEPGMSLMSLRGKRGSSVALLWRISKVRTARDEAG